MHWLDRPRLRFYGGGILLASLIDTLRCAWYTWKLYGQPDGMDFTTFWASSRLWLDGTPLQAYSFEAMARVGLQISPTLPPPGPLFYPPTPGPAFCKLRYSPSGECRRYQSIPSVSTLYVS